MAQSNPSVLTPSIHFPPRNPLYHSRSPSRSPTRSHRVAAHDLDPLLSNLSPDSTLQALQATDTISDKEQVSQALADSIADASTFERELGVRAAFAAQSIQEWLKELSTWKWANARERALGLGFLAPHSKNETDVDDGVSYLGSLSVTMIRQYEQRIADIKSDLNALQIEEVKDYVLDAHAISTWMSESDQDVNQQDRASYGRMRDFTALITATVIRTLPDLANLNGLLGIWSVRITVLKLVPDFVDSMHNTRVNIDEAASLLRLEKWAATLTRPKFEITRNDLADEVSILGAKVDKMLDLLEGQEDRLPQGWIDSLESVELGFATWAVEAQRRATHNEAVQASKRREGLAIPSGPDHIETPPLPLANDQIAGDSALYSANESRLPSTSGGLTKSPKQNDFVFPPPAEGSVRMPPPPHLNHLSLRIPSGGHRREISEVSLADSAYSGLTDISKAEIGDATTEVLASPKVSVIQTHSRSKSTDLSGLTDAQQPRIQSMPIPSVQRHHDHGLLVSHNRSKSHEPFGTNSVFALEQPVQRQNTILETDGEPPAMLGFGSQEPSVFRHASTASMESYDGSQVKRVTLSRNAGQDSERYLSNDLNVPAAPSQLVDAVAEVKTDGSFKNHQPVRSAGVANDTAANLSPEAAVSPASPLPALSGLNSGPVLPRRSSKRSAALESPITPIDHIDTSTSLPRLQPGESFSPIDEESPVRSTHKSTRGGSTLESKIQDILTTLPTSIRLAGDSEDSDGASRATTTSTTRSSSPTPALVLSPARKEAPSRRNTGTVSDVKEFHLTRPGQARDAPPTKLFVRLVGDAQRVMVRVGGGWADLGEYLREYSMHHGKRSVTDGRLEVASFPPAGAPVRDSPLAPESLSRTQIGLSAGGRSIASSSLSGPFDWSALPDVGVPGTTTVDANQPPLQPEGQPSSNSAEPNPPTTTSHTVYSPTITTSMSSTGASTTITPHDPLTSSSHFATTLNSPTSPPSSALTTRTPISPLTTTTAPIQGPKYTPLGAAGPKSASKLLSSRRASGFNVLTPAENEAWVEGMVGKARAVSGGTTTTTTSTTSPTISTTTTTTNAGGGGVRNRLFSSTPNSRRASANAATLLDRAATPTGSPGGVSAKSPAAGGSPGSQGSPGGGGLTRPKSRMSLGDMSGIKRVFLRKKTEPRNRTVT